MDLSHSLQTIRWRTRHSSTSGPNLGTISGKTELCVLDTVEGTRVEILLNVFIIIELYLAYMRGI